MSSSAPESPKVLGAPVDARTLLPADPVVQRKVCMSNPLRRSPHPLLLEIPARPWLDRLSRAAGRKLTLADVPDAELDHIAARGFHGVWLMGVWRTGTFARRLALTYPTLLAEYERLLPDWTSGDVEGSPYAIGSYEVARSLGGDESLAALRSRLHDRGLGLVLDFVGNHLARDHQWLDEHPEWFVNGTSRDLARRPADWFVHFGADGTDRIFAHGRDPHFDGWSDTVQVDVRVPAARAAMVRLVEELAGRCDGLRCDVAMLLLNDVFQKTWGSREDATTEEFWTEAIARIRASASDTVLLAEVYWGLESRMIELGFDFAYDKGILDLLSSLDLGPLRRACELPYESRRRRAHFLENHDEERAITVFGRSRLPAAALFAFTLPGLRFFLDGQAEGRSARVPVQIGRAPSEPDVSWSLSFHESLFAALRDPAFHQGAWSPIDARPVAPGDTTHEAIVGNRWTSETTTWLALSNLSGAQARARIPWNEADSSGGVRDAIEGREHARLGAESDEQILSVELAPHEARLLRAPARTKPPLEASSRG